MKSSPSKLKSFSENITTGSNQFQVFGSPRSSKRNHNLNLFQALNIAKWRPRRYPAYGPTIIRMAKQFKVSESRVLETISRAYAGKSLSKLEKNIIQTGWPTEFGKAGSSLGGPSVTTRHKAKWLARDLALKVTGKRLGFYKNAQEIESLADKLLPFLGWGILALRPSQIMPNKQVREYFKSIVKEELAEKFSEVNPRVAYGENYHRSVGWY